MMQYDSAAFATGEVWRPVDLPFDRFEPENLGTKVDPAKLERVAVDRYALKNNLPD